MSGYFAADDNAPQEEGKRGYLGNQNWQLGASLLIIASAIASVGFAIKNNRSAPDATQTDAPAAAAAAEQVETEQKAAEATR